MQKVILDCDNTFSVKRSDVDDGVTFMYLYASKDIDLLGVTTTFGNQVLHTVYGNTLQMMEDLGITGVPVLRGGRTQDDFDSEAADFLVEQVNKYPNEVSVLSIGSLHNLASAYSKDKEFFNKVKQVVVMGGAKQLVKANEMPHCELINGTELQKNAIIEELNFACANKSAYTALKNVKNLTIMTFQLTIEAWCSDFYIDQIEALDNEFSHYLIPIVRAWQKYQSSNRRFEGGFFNWDLTTAVYLTNPEIFKNETYKFEVSEEKLKRGLIPPYVGEGEFNIANAPSTILDTDKLNTLFVEHLKDFSKKIGK